MVIMEVENLMNEIGNKYKEYKITLADDISEFKDWCSFTNLVV